MKTLHAAYRVTDLDASLAVYTALGYDQVGRVDHGDGASLTMLKFPGEDVVTLELVHRPADGSLDTGTAFSHLPIQVDDLHAVVGALRESGLRPGPVERPGGSAAPKIASLTDPDGYRLELAQRPPGQPDGITAADDPIASFEGQLPLRRRCPKPDPHIACDQVGCEDDRGMVNHPTPAWYRGDPRVVIVRRDGSVALINRVRRRDQPESPGAA